MKDKHKTKAELIEELEKLRRRVTRLEKTQAPKKREGRRKPAGDELLEANRSLAIFKDVFDKIPIGLVIVQVEDREDPGSLRYAYMNLTTSKQAGYDVSAHIGRTVAEATPEVLTAGFARSYLDAALKQEPVDIGEFEYRSASMPVGGFFRLVAYPLSEDRVGVISEDITERRKLERAAQETREYVESIVATVREPLVVLDGDLRVISASRSFYQTFQVTPEKTEGQLLYELGNRQWEIPKLRKLLGEILPQNTTFDDFEMEHDFETIGQRTMLLNARRIYREAHRTQMVLLAIEDITERKRAEDRLAKVFTAVTDIVDNILHGELDDTEMEKRVLDACLAATGSAYGMIGAINKHGKYDTTTYNSRTLQDCAFPEALAWELSTGMTIRGIWGWPMLHGEPLLCNDPRAHPDWVGSPEGHVPIKSFLGVPLKREADAIGMMAVANKSGGYSAADLETLSRLAAIMAVSRQHREAMQRVRERTAQLETVNRELESFAYSVSHDLRAPLRAVEGFSQALLEDYPDKLNDQGKDYLQRISGEAHRMAQLINDLLKLSRVTRAEMRVEQVDLTSVARDVVAMLRQSEPERHVDVVIAEGLATEGDSQLLRQVLENMLGNAWKFTGPRPKAEVEFGAVEQEGVTAYFVKDNGVGFDMKYADKLFAPFQRLHGMKEFPGTGIGLSTVHRIIKRHGGRVWFGGEVGKGSTFYFTLHDKEETQDE